MADPVQYPADLPVANLLQLQLLERIALAVERIADAAEVKATPVAEVAESTVEPSVTSPTAQASHEHKHGRNGGARA